MKKINPLSKINLVNICMTCQNISCVACMISPDGNKLIKVDNFILNKNLLYYVKARANPKYYILDNDWIHLITVNIKKAISNNNIKIMEVIKIYIQ